VRDQQQELEKEGHIPIEKFNNYAEDFYNTALNIFRNGFCCYLCPFSPWIGSVWREG
jgi:hypothetical protein